MVFFFEVTSLGTSNRKVPQEGEERSGRGRTFPTVLARLNVCVLPKLMLKPNPKVLVCGGGASGRWLGWEWNPWMGLVPSLRRPQKGPPCLPLCANPVKKPLWAGKRGSPDLTCGCLTFRHLQKGEEPISVHKRTGWWCSVTVAQTLRHCSLFSSESSVDSHKVRPWLQGSLHVLKGQRVFYNWKFYRNLISKKEQ